MYVNLEHKAAFLCHPRTGSRSVADLFQRHGFQQVRNKPGLIQTQELPFRTVGDGHHARALERPDDWKFAATVRHHYDTIISSLFAHHLTRAAKQKPDSVSLEERIKQAVDEMTFEDFVKVIDHMHRSSDGLFYPKQDSLLPHMEHASFVIEYVYLEKDALMFLGETVGLHDGGDYEFKRIGESYRNGMPATDILKPEMREYIHGRYGAEMEDWGFLVDGKAVGYQ